MHSVPVKLTAITVYLQVGFLASKLPGKANASLGATHGGVFERIFFAKNVPIKDL